MELAPDHAVDWLISTLEASDGDVTLCTLGPLTNIGTALRRAPHLAGKVDTLVLMGGGFFEGGNTTPAAEFNIYVDPHAADIVFESEIDLVMMPLDVTHKALITAPRLEAFGALGTPVGDAVRGMLDFYERFDLAKYGSEGGPLHDPTVIAYLLRPELFSGRRCNVSVETHSELTMGMTVVDWWQVTDRPSNCMVMNEIDDVGFFDLLIERLAAL